MYNFMYIYHATFLRFSTYKFWPQREENTSSANCFDQEKADAPERSTHSTTRKTKKDVQKCTGPHKKAF